MDRRQKNLMNSRKNNKKTLKQIEKEKEIEEISSESEPELEEESELEEEEELEEEIESESSSEEVKISNLQQGYVVIEPNNKFLLLLTFLRKNPNKKIIVFFSSTKEVEFYTHLLNKFEINVKSTYGVQKQQKRTEEFFEFTKLETGILLCTELVQKDLVFPDVDWIIQYDAPQSIL